MGSALRLAAPAKINLHLRVGTKSDDGFHPVLTWMCTVALFDTLEFARAKSAQLDPLAPVKVTCTDPALACDASNLVMRAAAALAPLAQRNSGSPANIVIHLTKRIPMGGGLGGGSSNAAATLLGLNRLWNLDLSIEQLSIIAGSIGSDVPFFLHAPSSICSGRGETVQPTAPPKPIWCALFFPRDMQASTPGVYKRFDDLRLGSERVIESPPAWQDWSILSADQLLPLLVNDLEKPAFDLQPKLERIRGELDSLLQRRVRMSGSGSSLFTLFDARDDANRAAAVVNADVQQVRAMSVRLAPEQVELDRMN